MNYKLKDSMIYPGGSLAAGTIISESELKELHPNFDIKPHIKIGTIVPAHKAEDITPLHERPIGAKQPGQQMPPLPNKPAAGAVPQKPAAVAEAEVDEEEDALDSMDQTALRAMADEEGIPYAGNISDAKLREKIRNKRAEDAEIPPDEDAE